MYRHRSAQERTAFDNACREAPEQLRLLADILDGHTFDVLSGLGVRKGACCWDIGAGAGTVAHHLADRVGPDGHVLASDLDPQHVPAHPRLNAVRHDLTTDAPPEQRFDLIHARLVLMHLVDRAEIAVRLASRLRPGGALVLTDWSCDCQRVVVTPVDERTAGIWQRYHDAVHDLGGRAGMDLTWAERAPVVFQEAGYGDVATHYFRDRAIGGSPSALLARLHSHMLHEHLQEAGGLSANELDVIRENLLDPAFEMATYHTHTTVVRASGQGGEVR
ncbi:methyltransferase [Streptomyces olivaceiscleroticus]|uniref:Methyltransferase domain-containing protein n=1 Tax=Streptomyces olivaceiscleroticus TaxID=68245 RepID=A0ABN1BC83_9ACTN